MTPLRGRLGSDGYPGTMRAMREQFHPPVEDYLTTIYELSEDGINVIQARLAERLGHTPPAVSEMVTRLKTNGYLTISGRAISLTEKGRELAEGVVRKHRLAERLLTDVIGLPWHLAHLEAGRWEHVISDEVEQRLRVLLDDPSTCPHGNPIPGSKPSLVRMVALSDAEPGDNVRLERVTESVEIDNASMAYLHEHNFITGSVAKVTAKAPDGSLSLRVGRETVVVGGLLGSNLYVSHA